ncbi:MAG: hypothetical protein PF572_06750 [Patescibacteria group bacterium]|jgi:hypothetical protein|nr:hypothetical protein [Patescibacteria group bacterium]
MGELLQFPGGGREKKEPIKESEESPDFSSFDERTAINTLFRDRFDFMVNLKKGNPVNKSSDTYVNAYDLLKKSSRVSIAEMINNASEIEIKMKPAYYTAAFNILCE